MQNFNFPADRPMSMKIRLIAALVLLGLAACSQLAETGKVVSDNNGALADSDVRYLGQKRYQLRVKGSSLLLDGLVEQQFRQRATEYTSKLGCKRWLLHEYRAGTENTLLGARQYAEGIVECVMQ